MRHLFPAVIAACLAGAAVSCAPYVPRLAVSAGVPDTATVVEAGCCDQPEVSPVHVAIERLDLPGLEPVSEPGELCLVTARIDGEAVTVSPAVHEEHAVCAHCGDAQLAQLQRAAASWRLRASKDGEPASTDLELRVRVEEGPGDSVEVKTRAWRPGTAQPAALRVRVPPKVKGAPPAAPRYPPSAKGQAQPDVTCDYELDVDAEGRVSSIRVDGCPPDFVAAVEEVLPSWRFYPATVNKEPAEGEVHNRINFRMR